jgi:uncharacterized metal-binding protein
VVAPNAAAFDCLVCENRVCLRGEPCAALQPTHQLEDQPEMQHMLDSAMDIAAEPERTLCRLSELVYFCLEMEYHTLGLAYCIDLEEPCQVLVGLLRRLFTVIPVCCKVGGVRPDATLQTPAGSRAPKPAGSLGCNPAGQAALLNQLDTELNIAVGLCMGADCVFAATSRAPVTTFVVKDRSLANNPIGALYSDHYLKEAAWASVGER